MMSKILELIDFKVEVEEKQVVRGVDLGIEEGSIHALMGPNGSGKSSLANAIIGHPKYKILEGSKATFRGKDILGMVADERARDGILMAFQSPIAVPGVKVFTFLREAYRQLGGGDLGVGEFKKKVVKIMERVGLESEFLGRYINDGFSGGERKKMEILQMLLFKPKLMIIDEIDSGLDVDSLKVVAEGITSLVKDSGSSVIIISHYKRILEYVKPQTVHIMKEGLLINSGDIDLIDKIEEKGYLKLEGKNG